MDLIGRQEKFAGRRVVVKFSPFAAGQSRYLFLRCRVRPDAVVNEMNLALVNVTYRDERNGSQETNIEQNVGIGVTANPQEAAGSINQTIGVERELQLNALAKDKAMAEADTGNFRGAADSLRANAKKLEAAAASAPLPAKESLELQAQEQRARAEEIAARGMSKALRKTIQSESYSRRNGKER